MYVFDPFGHEIQHGTLCVEFWHAREGSTQGMPQRMLWAKTDVLGL